MPNEYGIAGKRVKKIRHPRQLILIIGSRSLAIGASRTGCTSN